MVTSAEFDNVLVPVDYQKDVLVRTFDSLIGFNKKNKKGKFMKAIKEEWVWDPAAKKSVFKDREAERRATKAKIDNGTYKVVSLDAKKKPKVEKTDSEKKTEIKKKAEGKELYAGTLVNKKGKTLEQIEKEAREKIRVPRAIRKEIVEPGDTHYTCQELAKKFYTHSAAVREKFASELDLLNRLLVDEKLRKKLDEKRINKYGHKTDEEMRKSRKASAPKEKIELEKDPSKITDWFWAKKDEPDFKVLFPGVTSRYMLSKAIENDERGIKFFAKIMKDRGYRLTPDKPFVAKATLIKKKGDAACDWEKEGEAARGYGFNDAVEVLRGPIERVKKAYKDSDQRIGIGINWAMEELFGSGWEKI